MKSIKLFILLLLVSLSTSAQTAFVEGVFESASWVMEAGQFIRLDMDMERERLLKAKRAELFETKLQIFEKFLKNL